MRQLRLEPVLWLPRQTEYHTTWRKIPFRMHGTAWKNGDLQVLLISRVKTTLKSGAIREQKQRIEVINGGLGIHECIMHTPNDPNPACDSSDCMVDSS